MPLRNWSLRSRAEDIPVFDASSALADVVNSIRTGQAHNSMRFTEAKKDLQCSRIYMSLPLLSLA